MRVSSGDNQTHALLCRFSVSNDLKYDAERDLKDIEASHIPVHALNKVGETRSWRLGKAAGGSGELGPPGRGEPRWLSPAWLLRGRQRSELLVFTARVPSSQRALPTPTRVIFNALQSSAVGAELLPAGSEKRLHASAERSRT